MHVKTNIEHTITQIIILSICPLLLVFNNFKEAIFFAVSTSICFLISAFICMIFNRFLSRNIKIFITALLSTFIITLINELLKAYPFWGLEANDNFFFAVLSTMCLCVDIYYIETKAVVKHFMLRVLIYCLMFIAIFAVFSVIFEFIAYGTLIGFKVISYSGTPFFQSYIFKFILLGFYGIFVDAMYRAYTKLKYQRRLTYQKYIKKIREEKAFQYDELRRKKLLASPVEIKHISNEKADEITQKISENETIKVEDEAKKEPEEKEEVKKSPKSKKKHKLGVYARVLRLKRFPIHEKLEGMKTHDSNIFILSYSLWT